MFFSRLRQSHYGQFLVPNISLLFKRLGYCAMIIFIVCSALVCFCFVIIGYCWSREVQNYNDCLLPRCHGLHSHVWRHQRGVFQRRSRLVSIATIACRCVAIWKFFFQIPSTCSGTRYFHVTGINCAHWIRTIMSINDIHCLSVWMFPFIFYMW